jgi:hypothetical protein
MPKMDFSWMTKDQVECIRWFAWHNGRYWKQALRDQWMVACRDIVEIVPGQPDYRAHLQLLRNHPKFGPSGLINYRLPKGFKFQSSK